MLDISFIRSNPSLFNDKQNMRGAATKADGILALDSSIRALKAEIQGLQSRRNELAKLMPKTDALIAEARDVKNLIASKSEELAKHEAELNALMLSIPNMIADDVPYGESDADNEELRKFGEKPVFDFKPLTHYELCEEQMGNMDFKTPSVISGARFSVLKGKLARLERAVANYLLDIHTMEFGYQEISVPFLVKDIALYGTGQLPKFQEDLFKTTDGMWLIPTAEVYLTNLARESILKDADLPLRFVAETACFRSEAGAAGRDTRGIVRQHQFNKVELVSVVRPEDSEAEHERMTNAAETVLQRLGLHYRVVKLCSKDIGFSARKTYDIEVWVPGLNRYMEISSCSNCWDFQARRMKTRIKRETGNVFAHTLNGSGVAVGRLLVAIIENYQTKDGKIKIPEALLKYLPFSEI